MKIIQTIIFVITLSAISVFADSKERNPYNLDLIIGKSEYKRLVELNPDNEMINLEKYIKNVKLDIRYATTNNFTGKKIYTAPKAYVRKPVAEALAKVRDSLSKLGLGFKIFDAYRPYAATLYFYEVYPDTNFVANPRYGSRHNRGCAVDLTLIDLKTGKDIPMPSEFDDFSAKADPNYNDLPESAIANRRTLFGVMSYFGFDRYPSEWWHFDFKGWDKFKLMDLSFEELESD